MRRALFLLLLWSGCLPGLGRRRLPPAFLRQPPARVFFREGEPFRLQCEATGDPHPKYVWHKNGEESLLDNRMIASGSLDFDSPNKSDEGTYQCLAQNRYGIAVSRESTVSLSEMGVFPEVEARAVLAAEGAPLSLSCDVPFGVPDLEIDWIIQSDGSSFGNVDSALTAVDPGGGLHFSGVRREDARPGTFYACVARSPRLGRTALGSRVALRIDAASADAAAHPIVEQFVSPLTLALEGETLNLVCIFGGTPAPEVSWLKEGRGVRGPRVSFCDRGRTLRVAGLRPDDAGVYECVASNGLHAPRSAHVQVRVQGRPFWTEAAPDSIGAEGGDVSFVCAAGGTPPPEVKWFVNGTALPDSNGRIEGNATSQTFSIENLKQTDVAVYQCRATNVHGSILHNFYLDVLTEEEARAEEERVERDAGRPSELRCRPPDADADAEVVWLRGGRVLEPGPEPDVRRLAAASAADAGVYECLLETNDSRRIAKRVRFVVRDVPPAPLLDAVRCDGSSALLRWSAAGDGGSPVLAYELQVRTGYAPDDWKSVRRNLTDTSYTASLSPWASSSFRVVARNAVGAGPASAPSSPCASPEDVPRRNPEQVRGRGTSKNNLVISWSPIPPEEQSAAGFFYRVQWRPAEDGAWSSEDVRDWERSKLVVSGQPSFAKYLIRVEAHNSKGPAPVAAREVVGYSGENVPLEAPQNLTCVSVSDSRTAVLSWLPVDPETVRGHFKGYKVQAWLEEEDEERLWEAVVRPHLNESAVQMFRPASTHRVRLLAFNDKYDGPPSAVVTVTTPEGTPGIVESFEAWALGSSALYLRWRPPLQTNGVLVGYRLYCANTAVGLLEELSPRIADPRRLSALVGGLAPDAVHRVAVRAETAVGEGQSFFLEARTGRPPLAAPDEPDFRYEWLANRTALEVTWTPDVAAHPGSSFLVQFRERGEAEWRTRAPENHEDFVRLLDLEPDAAYELRGVAEDAGLATTGRTVPLDPAAA